MAMSSNEKRALERTKCREALAAHIQLRLGLVVAPNQVRLQPRAEDKYAWSVTEPNKHLLQSSLSGGNVRLYRSICEELGRSLEAVTPLTLQSSPSDPESSAEEPPHQVEKGTVSFTAQIRELEAANRELGIDLDRARSRLEESLGESSHLKSENSRLQAQLQASESRARDFEVELDRVRLGVTEAVQVLSRGGSESGQHKSNGIGEPGKIAR
ncbi:uncharacterized protein N7477_008996 [Penicillium maclennaniae]|uniref:uncharacterized protein n=1 Tax=Penicillium maclennaniae TaxID=1343394 RepID=UPI0025412B7A|nr:uncharacterized protein N7477_008996 [Penicillium maclennaniae]KAJ5666548.1 hypothetical protein N7477_008996 [Penicillium maclennaniae]